MHLHDVKRFGSEATKEANTKQRFDRLRSSAQVILDQPCRTILSPLLPTLPPNLSTGALKTTRNLFSVVNNPHSLAPAPGESTTSPASEMFRTISRSVAEPIPSVACLFPSLLGVQYGVSVSESSLEIRNAFVRKVYTILCTFSPSFGSRVDYQPPTSVP